MQTNKRKPLAEQWKTGEILVFLNCITGGIRTLADLKNALLFDYSTDMRAISFRQLCQHRLATRGWLVQFITEYGLIEQFTKWEEANQPPYKFIFAKRALDFQI